MTPSGFFQSHKIIFEGVVLLREAKGEGHSSVRSIC